MARPLLLALLIALSLTVSARAQESPPRDYEHDRFVTQPTEAVREFQAFKVSFDTDEDGVALGGRHVQPPVAVLVVAVPRVVLPALLVQGAGEEGLAALLHGVKVPEGRRA